MITEEIVDVEHAESILRKNMRKFPEVAKFINENPDDVPSFFFEEELISHEEWKAHFEKRLYERLGLRIKL
jgi:hypothetical protein